MTHKIKVYGTIRCHKTQYYKNFLSQKGLEYEFLDVEMDSRYADELRGLYENRKLNFPTLTIGKKRLRNPTNKELDKWLEKPK